MGPGILRNAFRNEHDNFSDWYGGPTSHWEAFYIRATCGFAPIIVAVLIRTPSSYSSSLSAFYALLLHRLSEQIEVTSKLCGEVGQIDPAVEMADCLPRCQRAFWSCWRSSDAELRQDEASVWGVVVEGDEGVRERDVDEDAGDDGGNSTELHSAEHQRHGHEA